MWHGCAGHGILSLDVTKYSVRMGWPNVRSVTCIALIVSSVAACGNMSMYNRCCSSFDALSMILII